MRAPFAVTLAAGRRLRATLHACARTREHLEAREALRARQAGPGSNPRPRTAAGPPRARDRPEGRSPRKPRALRPATWSRSSAPPRTSGRAPAGAVPRPRPPRPRRPARRGRSALSRPRRRPRTALRPSTARSLLELLLLLAGPDLGLHLRQLVVDLRLRRERAELAVELRLVRGEVLEGAGGRELVDRGGPSLHLLGLVLRPLDRETRVRHLLADPRRRLADPHLRLGRRVLRLDRLLLRPERLDLGRKRLLAGDELLLLLLELLCLLVETLHFFFQAEDGIRDRSRHSC